MELPDSRRRMKLIGAAEHVFLKCGYHAATMDEVAARAKMSKRTLYKVFATKETLFRAMVAERSQVLMTDIEESGLSPDEVLVALLRKAADFVLAPKQVALCRLIIAERSRSPRLARAFLQSGPERGLDAIERWLANLDNRGLIGVADVAVAARMVFGITIGFTLLALLLGTEKPPTRPEMDSQIRLGVRVFLSGCGWQSERPRDGYTAS